MHRRLRKEIKAKQAKQVGKFPDLTQAPLKWAAKCKDNSTRYKGWTIGNLTVSLLSKLCLINIDWRREEPQNLKDSLSIHLD